MSQCLANYSCSLHLIVCILEHQMEHETVAQAKLDEEEVRVMFPDKETEITPPR